MIDGMKVVDVSPKAKTVYFGISIPVTLSLCPLPSFIMRAIDHSLSLPFVLNISLPLPNALTPNAYAMYVYFE
jgi:hypothetical protein